MSDELNKEKSRKALRALWNEFDPIGVIAIGAPLDEYDAYVGPTMRLLEQNASEAEIAAYTKGEVTGCMGMTWNDRLEEKTGILQPIADVGLMEAGPGRLQRHRTPLLDATLPPNRLRFLQETL